MSERIMNDEQLAYTTELMALISTACDVAYKIDWPHFNMIDAHAVLAVREDLASIRARLFVLLAGQQPGEGAGDG